MLPSGTCGGQNRVTCHPDTWRQCLHDLYISLGSVSSFILWHIASDLVSFRHKCHLVRVRRRWFGLRYLHWSPRTRLKMCQVLVKNPKVWAPISSVGRTGVPGAEAWSSLQRPRVWVLAWGPLLRVTAPLFHPVSCHLSVAVQSIKPYEGQLKDPRGHLETIQWFLTYERVKRSYSFLTCNSATIPSTHGHDRRIINNDNTAHGPWHVRIWMHLCSAKTANIFIPPTGLWISELTTWIKIFAVDQILFFAWYNGAQTTW